jgi:DNA-binding PadR family transcriptional regulator
MVRYAILWLLRDGPDYGYSLKARFERDIGPLWQLNPGQIYQTLKSLKKAGLVAEVGGSAGDDQRIRRRYVTTAKGQRMLARWFRRTAGRPYPVRDETLVRLLELEGGGAHVHACLEAQHASHRRQLERLSGERSMAAIGGTVTERVRRLAIEAAYLHTRAHLEWLDACRREFAAASLTGREGLPPPAPVTRAASVIALVPAPRGVERAAAARTARRVAPAGTRG